MITSPKVPCPKILRPSVIRRRPLRQSVVGVAILVVLFYAWWEWRSGTVGKPPKLRFPRDDVANRTLGFEKILTVSYKPGWRTQGLQAAAKLTGLEITIPRQPHNPSELVRAFEKMSSENDNELRRGSATAWIAHLDMMKYVISSEFTTALVLEDDVDWDVDLVGQMQRMSDNIRVLLKNEPGERETGPYGNHWDVLWIGHCGEASDREDNLYIDYPDSHRIDRNMYSGWSKKFWANVIPRGHRRLQMATMPVCSFGYGVTSLSAQKILQFLGRGGDEAFDVALQKLCAKELRCLTVVPQLMHHYIPPADLNYVSPVATADGHKDEASQVEDEAVMENMGTTANIVYSARCKALYDTVCIGTSP